MEKYLKDYSYFSRSKDVDDSTPSEIPSFDSIISENEYYIKLYLYIREYLYTLFEIQRLNKRIESVKGRIQELETEGKMEGN